MRRWLALFGILGVMAFVICLLTRPTGASYRIPLTVCEARFEMIENEMTEKETQSILEASEDGFSPMVKSPIETLRWISTDTNGSNRYVYWFAEVDEDNVAIISVHFHAVRKRVVAKKFFHRRRTWNKGGDIPANELPKEYGFSFHRAETSAVECACN